MIESFQTTDAWLGFQMSLGRSVWRVQTDVFRAVVVRHDVPLSRNYLYLGNGPSATLAGVEGGLHNAASEFVAQVRKLGEAEGAMFVKAEPLTDAVAELLVQAGFRRSTKALQPHRTVRVDLTCSERELLDRMHRKLRYNIGVGERSGLTIERSDDPSLFIDLMSKTTERDRFHAHPASYYTALLNYFADPTGEIQTQLWVARLGGVPVAAMILLIHRDTAYYLHGASDWEHRQTMAPSWLHWQVMRWAKTRGLAVYDLWGIDAQRYPGVTRFKLSFGGQTVEYPGAFDLPLSWWYWVYRGFQYVWRR